MKPPANQAVFWTAATLALLAAVLSLRFPVPAWAAIIFVSLLWLTAGRVMSGRANRAIRASRASAMIAMTSNPLAMLLFDEQGSVLAANPAFRTLVGLADESSTSPLVELPKGWQESITDILRQTRSRGNASHQILLPTSTTNALLRVSAQLLAMPDGQNTILLMAENLSGHNQTLNQLFEREKQLLERSRIFVQTLIDVIPQPVYIKQVRDTDSHYLLANTAFCSLHNRSKSEMAGASIFDLFKDHKLAQMVLHEDRRVLDGFPVFREEQGIDEQTGKDRFTIVCKQACVDAEGSTVLVGTNFDVTPWRMAERNLKQALQREVVRREQVQSFVQRLIDVIPYPVHVKDSRCRYLMVNDAFARERGRSREQLLGKDPVEVVKLMVGERLGAQDTERARALLSLEEDQRVLAGDTIVKEEHNHHSVTGAERYRTVYKGGCLDAEGQPVIVTAFFDISKWRVAEAQLAQALDREKMLRERTLDFTQRLLDLIPEEFYVKDADSRFLLVNQAFLRRRMLQSRDQVIGRSMEEVAVVTCEANPAYHGHPDVLAGAIADHKARVKTSRDEDLAVLAGHNLLKEDHHILPHTGEERFFLVAKSAATDAEGRPVIVCLNFNVTALRLAERKIRELQSSPADA